MRTLVNIGEVEIEALDQIAQKENVSRAALIRKAINDFLEKQGTHGDAFGIWGEPKVDGLDYQRDVRREW